MAQALHHRLTAQQAAWQAHSLEREGGYKQGSGNGPAGPEADCREAERSGVRLSSSHRIQFPADSTRSGAGNMIMWGWRKPQILQWDARERPFPPV